MKTLTAVSVVVGILGVALVLLWAFEIKPNLGMEQPQFATTQKTISSTMSPTQDTVPSSTNVEIHEKCPQKVHIYRKLPSSTVEREILYDFAYANIDTIYL